MAEQLFQLKQKKKQTTTTTRELSGGFGKGPEGPA